MWLFRASIAFLLALAIFVYGFAVAWYGIPPKNAIVEMVTVTKSLLKFGAVVPKNLLVDSPDDSSGQQFFVHAPELMVEGYYAFLVWDDHNSRNSAWLYNHRGEHLHTWALDYAALDSDGPLNGGDEPHGFHVLRDGSIIVNFDRGDVLARIDSCSNPVWSKQGVYHHSLQEAEDGSYWTWLGEGSAYSQYQYLENFDPENGATIRKIGLVEDVVKKTGAASSVFLIRPDFRFQRFDKDPGSRDDIFHPNDIDVLYSDLAPMFPDLDAGDLLISLKTMNLVAILDPDDLVVKWWSHGPWRKQHDPDFTSDGKISVYNNNSGLDRSEIIKIDPGTGEITNELFDGEVRFYSEAMGKHQYLPNGNVLIVVPEEGRVLVASSSGQKVMEFNNISAKSAKYYGHFKNALWMPMNYFDNLPDCSE